MKHTRPILTLTALTGLFFIFFMHTSCASMGVQREPSVLIDRAEPMFWELQGMDSKGNPATVYVFGTLNFAEVTSGKNPKTMNLLSDTIVKTFFAADKLVAEVSSEDLENLGSEIEKQMMKSVSLDKKVVDVRTLLTDAEAELLNHTLGKSSADATSLYAPWVTTSLLIDPLYKKTTYTQNNGLDAVLINTAAQQKLTFEGLDSLSDQIELLTFGTEEEQIILLKRELADLANSEYFLAHLDSLYNAYLSPTDAESMFASVIETERARASAENSVYELYTVELLNKRNERWAKKIDEFMAEGGTTFVFAGAEHFTGIQSVFSYMEVNGTLVLSTATELIAE